MPSAFAEPNQEKEIKSKAASLHHHALRQQAACHNIIPMIEVIDEPVIVTRPFPHSRRVLQVVHIRIGRLLLL